jgi:4-hydroxy-tetrahydrodipicolinate reductase
MSMQRKINVMVNGLPGKMATAIAERVLGSEEFSLVPFSLTGPEISEMESIVSTSRAATSVALIHSAGREILAEQLKEENPFISVDATQPSAVNDNADFYCRHSSPFVMLTTGGDRTALEARIRNSDIAALPHTNMAAPIVRLLDFMDQYSQANEGALASCVLGVTESHQAKKIDTSGTARTMLKYFRRLGIKMDDKLVEAVDKFKMKEPEDVTLPLGYDSQFTLIRNSKTQLALGIPAEHLGGHGWHTYGIETKDANGYMALFKLRGELNSVFMDGRALKGYSVDFLNENLAEAISPDKNVLLGAVELRQSQGFFGLSITHNINGRSVYVDGTMDAIRFLDKKVHDGEKGKVYSMIDVLKTG